MQIDVANTEAIDAVVALLGSQFKEHGIALGLDELSEAVRGLISDAERGIVLMAQDPEPVGVAVLAFTWTLEHGGRVAWLDELFVIPEHRGRGIGRALLRRALDIARENGCRAVDLEVDSGHAQAERLYQREGFASLPRRRWASRLR
jgi:GNAT superfamily N-acetyltransferase